MNNKSILQKKIDLPTALKLLDPTIYNYDLNHFRKCIFETNNEDLKNFNFKNLDNTYKKYLSSVISEETIRQNWEIELSINASMNFENALFVEYKSVNHHYYCY